MIQQDTLSGLAGLELAVDILESNEADTLLVGHCDIGPPDFIQTGEPAPDLPALFFVLRPLAILFSLASPKQPVPLTPQRKRRPQPAPEAQHRAALFEKTKAFGAPLRISGSAD